LAGGLPDVKVLDGIAWRVLDLSGPGRGDAEVLASDASGHLPLVLRTNSAA